MSSKLFNIIKVVSTELSCMNHFPKSLILIGINTHCVQYLITLTSKEETECITAITKVLELMRFNGISD